MSLQKVSIVVHSRAVVCWLNILTSYNKRRPHQGLAQQSPAPHLPVSSEGTIQKKPVFGGTINDYWRVSTLPATRPA